MEFTTNSDFPNEFKSLARYRKRTIKELRSYVLLELKNLRKAYYNNNYRSFSMISRRMLGYYHLDMISYACYCRVVTMRFERGLPND